MWLNLLLFSEDSPVITVEVIDQTLNEGDTAFFTCQATGTPIPKITWYFNGAPVEKATTIKYVISEMSLNPTTKNSTLTVMILESSNIGTYTCKATNIVASDTSSALLTVNGECVSVAWLVMSYTINIRSILLTDMYVFSLWNTVECCSVQLQTCLEQLKSIHGQPNTMLKDGCICLTIKKHKILIFKLPDQI